jgi:hypothetical protein
MNGWICNPYLLSILYLLSLLYSIVDVEDTVNIDNVNLLDNHSAVIVNVDVNVDGIFFQHGPKLQTFFYETIMSRTLK